MKQADDKPKVWVTITRKINTGNYESGEIQAGLSKTYSEKDDPIKLLSETTDELQKIILKKAKNLKKKLT